MLNRLPISITAPLLVGIPVLVVGVWLSVMWNRQSRHAVKQLADKNIGQIHNMAATKVADELSIPVRVCQVNEHLVQAGKLRADDPASWRPTLLRQARAFDMLSAISWGGADGRTAWVSRYGDGSHYWAVKTDGASSQMSEWRLNDQGEVADEPSSTFKFDLFTRPWFKAPQAAGKPAWSEPYVWVGGVDSEGVTLGISYGIPLFQPGGELLGIVDADFSLNALSSFLRSVRIGKTGVAVLVDHNGKLLASSGDAPIVTPKGERLAAGESSSLLIAATAGHLNKSGNETTRTDVQIDGETHYLCISPIGEEVGLDWKLATIIPERDFVAQIESDFQRSWVTSLIAVALAVVVGLAASRWLVSPLMKIVTAVRRIGQGDLDTRVNVRHAPEYTNLAQEINRMTEGLQDRVRMRESLSLAMEVQQNLLPSESPVVKRLDIAGHSTYCDETGGDYYDFLDVSDADEDTAVVAVGDVMGHGVAAAMLMATARGILRSRCSVAGSLADFLDHLNEMLVPDTNGQRFMTMLLLTVSATRDELRWASAGHGPPIVYDPAADSFPELEGGGLPLGLTDDEDYREYVQPGIGSGCIIVAATDGLWETMGGHDEIFGMDRVRELLRKHAQRPAAEISDIIRDTLADFRGPAGQDDDLTFVIAKVI